MVEAPRVGAVYADLVAQTRSIAGAYIRAAWAQPSGIAVGDMNVADVDLSPLEELDVAYLASVRAALALPPHAWILHRRATSLVAEAKAHLLARLERSSRVATDVEG